LKTILGILLLIFSVASFTRGQPLVKTILNDTISLDFTNQRLSDVLSFISKKGGIDFSYDASVVVSERPVSVKIDGKTIREALSVIFDTNLFAFIEKENQIIISLIEDGQEENVVEETKPLETNFIRLSGKLVDESNMVPLQYASVSVMGKPVGTITNAEGDYILKIPPSFTGETIIVSCMGYAQKFFSVHQIERNSVIGLTPISIRIREVRVNAVTPEELLDKVVQNISNNYGSSLVMMKAFYRETLKQDENYINVSEAVLEILKSPYLYSSSADNVRIIKGRKSRDVNPFKWVNFKLQGGPFTITQLDVLKAFDSFIDPEYRSYYKYDIDRVIWYHGKPVFVLQFKPERYVSFPCFLGEIYIERETFAVMHVSFSYGKPGLRLAEQSLIKKKPKGFKVKPVSVEYQVDYRENNGRWYLNSARASVFFKVRSQTDNINSTFHSVSEMLVTNMEKSQIKRFPRKQLFTVNDIFTELITNYDEEFWGNFNIIQPDEDLQNAIRNMNVTN